MFKKLKEKIADAKLHYGVGFEMAVNDFSVKLNSVFDSFTKRISNSTNLVDLSSYTIDKIISSIKKFKIESNSLLKIL